MWTVNRVVEFDLSEDKWHVMPGPVETVEPAAPPPTEADLGDLDFDIDEWFTRNGDEVAAMAAARFL